MKIKLNNINKYNICNVKIAYVVVLIFLIVNISFQKIKAADKSAHFNSDSICDSINSRLSNNNNPDTIFYLSELLIKKAESNWYYKHHGYYFKGKAYFLTGDYEKAIDNYFISLQIAKTNNYLKGVGIIYNSLGSTYSSTKDFDNSILFQKKATQSFFELKDTILLGSSIFNLGRTYSKIEKYDSALFFLQEAYDLFKKVNYTSGMAYCLGLIGNINYFQGNIKTAQNNLKESIDILMKLEDYYPISSFYLRMANTEQDQKNYIKAVVFADSSYEIAKKYGYLTQQRDAAERLYLIYSESGDFKNAFTYQSEFIALRDSIINEETIRKMADLRTEYEVSQKQAEIDVLNKTKRIQQIIGIGLGVIILLALALIMNMKRSARRQKRLTRKLGEQKEELQAQYELLDDLNKTKDRFFSIISHDLRGPIGVLKGTTMLIREYVQSKDYIQLAELTANMEFSVKKVQNLLDNLLEWALNQQGKFKRVSERIELNQIIYDVINTYHDIAVSKEIKVIYSCKYDELNIFSDPNSLMTIFRNLLSNAIKFTKRNGTITIATTKDTDSISITVEDNGVGIPKSKLERLFKIDENKSTWGTEREKGLGIGLNLVNEFVKLNEGTILVESEPGVGTKFTIKLPVVFEEVENIVEQA